MTAVSFAALALVVAALAGVLLLDSPGCDQAFDRVAWADGDDSRRLDTANRMVECGTLVGRDVRDVRRMLAPAAGVSPHSARYGVGPAGTFQLPSHLSVRWKGDRVVDAEVVVPD